MNTIRLSARAKSDLEDIADYLSGFNPAAAARVLDAIEETLLALAASPKIGRKRDDLLQNLRIHPARRPADSYVIFYFPMDEGIEVAAVMHGSRNWEAWF
jgi:toxin ParE1/3/4